MSKITVTTIAGATSGSDANKVKIESGDTLEVVSNATVGGDLTVDTDTLFVDASADKVGINNAAPNHELQINGNSTTSSLALKTSATGNATSDGLELKVQGDSAAYLYNYENAMLRFGTNGLERVRIDANGNVTIPSQPAFHIQGTGSAHTGGNETAIGYASTPTIKYNIGNHGVGGTGATSGRFTCPVAGIYLVSCTWYRGNTGSPSAYMGTLVKKNGVSFYSYWYNNAANYGDASVGQTGMIQCAANDVLQQYVYGASSDADPTTTMQIYLLG